MTLFYCLSAPGSEKKWAAWNPDDVKLEPVLCPRFPGHGRTGKRLSQMSVILQTTVVDDFVWTWFSECLVQDRVIRLFRKHRISGWTVKPARAKFRRSKERPPRLWEFVVTGWGGLAPKASGIRLKKWCRHCGDTFYSPLWKPVELVDAKKWDGSDIFIIWPLPRFILVTEKVVSLLQEHRLTGWTATPVEKLRLHGGFSPGRLEYYMPARLVRERAESAELK